MDTYILSLLIIQGCMWVAGKIWKMEDKVLPEMIMLLTIIVAFK